MMIPNRVYSMQPRTFNELLDLFEAYLATIPAPLKKAREAIYEELNYRQGEIFADIIGVVDLSEQMQKSLKALRAAHNSGTDFALTLSQIEANSLEGALGDVDRVLSSSAAALELLRDRADNDTENEDTGGRAVMELTERALFTAYEYEGAKLRTFAAKLRKARAYQSSEQEQVA